MYNPTTYLHFNGRFAGTPGLAGSLSFSFLHFFWRSTSVNDLPSVLRHYWLGGRKGIRPVKNGGMVEVGTG